MKLYNLVKQILNYDELARNSDKQLLWRVFEELGIKEEYITKDQFMSMPSSESITRARRKVQELNIELRSNMTIQRARNKIKQQKGTHVFREEVKGRYEGNKYVIYENKTV